MWSRPIVARKSDARAILGSLASVPAASSLNQAQLEEYCAKLDRALVLDSGQVPADVVAIGTRVRVLDLASGKHLEFALVFPEHSDPPANRISALSPLGAALLGCREGDEVEWKLTVGLRSLLIERVFQMVDANTDGTREPVSAPPLAGSDPVVYDAVDRRLMDTFPASDAVARY